MIAEDEENDGPRPEPREATMREPPAAQEGVVRSQLVDVVGGATGEVQLDEQVECEPDPGDLDLQREVGLDLPERSQVEDRMPLGDLELCSGELVALVAVADLRDRVAAGGVARCPPVVGGERRDHAVKLERP